MKLTSIALKFESVDVVLVSNQHHVVCEGGRVPNSSVQFSFGRRQGRWVSINDLVQRILPSSLMAVVSNWRQLSLRIPNPGTMIISLRKNRGNSIKVSRAFIGQLNIDAIFDRT